MFADTVQGAAGVLSTIRMYSSGGAASLSQVDTV